MPRRREPPRLWLRSRAGRASVYVILDGGLEVSTGCGPDRRREAEEAFSRYLAAKHEPDFADGDPRHIHVSDCLTYYLENLRDDHQGPEATHIAWLVDHFGDLTCSKVNADSCRSYVHARTSGTLGKRPVVMATARRELDTLGAALNYAWKAGKMNRPIAVMKPEVDEREARWLSRDEAARLIYGALGFTPKAFHTGGRVRSYIRVAKPNYHVARFILVALYTATRHAAVLGLRWERNPRSGSVDLKEGRLYRRGTNERETRKRRRPCPIPNRLLPHLHRWRRMTISGPCEYAGQIIQRQKTGFEAARRLSGLGSDVTPHTLKHTCITWMLQAGVPIWEVAGFTSTSAKLIEARYGHHCPNHMENARSALGRRKAA